MSLQTINLFIIGLILLHGEVGGSSSHLPHLLPAGPSGDLPDPFLPGPFDVDHHHIARLSSIHFDPNNGSVPFHQNIGHSKTLYFGLYTEF